MTALPSTNAPRAYEHVRSPTRPHSLGKPRPLGDPADPAEYLPIDEAAPRLSLTPLALRARCRRAARRDGRVISAHLGGGIVAYKFGRSWRVRFAPGAA